MKTQSTKTTLRCHVAGLADQFNDLSAAWERADDAHDNDASGCLQSAMDNLIDAASYLEPRSLKGAAFQIMAASAQGDSILNGIGRDYREAAKQRLMRLLHQAIQRLGSDDDIPHVAEHLMPRRHKPGGKQQ